MLLHGGRDSLSSENGNASARRTEFVLREEAVPCFWQTGCRLEQPVFGDGARYYVKQRQFSGKLSAMDAKGRGVI